MQHWEYLTVWVRVDELEAFQEKLDEYGNLGWELVSLAPIASRLWFGVVQTSGLVAVFKRPKP